MSEAAEIARFLERYARRHAGGAFATPTARELERSVMRRWTDGEHVTVAVVRDLVRPSRRRDWTGEHYEIPAGAKVVSHLARTPGAPVPDFGSFDVVDTYLDDWELSEALEGQGREVWAVRISAASEIIGAWGRAGLGHRYADVDRVTVAPMPLSIEGQDRAAILTELAEVELWHDDYPYYSDGSWSAVSLRGFRPDDPSWGVKPAEMNRKWHLAHPEAAAYTCDWTVLAARCPTMRAAIEGVEWWGEVERVRLLKMAGRPDRAGILRRHTDITDRAGGTRDGQVVRFHIPLLTHPDVTMHWWELDGRARSTHLAPWRAWYLDARKPHAVTNPTPIDRIHLVADVVSSSAVRARIEAA